MQYPHKMDEWNMSRYKTMYSTDNFFKSVIIFSEHFTTIFHILVEKVQPEMMILSSGKNEEIAPTLPTTSKQPITQIPINDAKV